MVYEPSFRLICLINVRYVYVLKLSNSYLTLTLNLPSSLKWEYCKRKRLL